MTFSLHKGMDHAKICISKMVLLELAVAVDEVSLIYYQLPSVAIFSNSHLQSIHHFRFYYII